MDKHVIPICLTGFKHRDSAVDGMYALEKSCALARTVI